MQEFHVIRLCTLFLLCLVASPPALGQTRQPTETTMAIEPASIRAGRDASFFAGVWSDSGTPTGEVVFRTPTRTLARATLRPVPPGSGPISNGLSRTCALRPNGAILCWGANHSSSIGDGTYAMERRAPTPVLRLPGPMVQVATGDSHNCALSEAGGAYCWGDNTEGQIGNGVTDSPYGSVRFPTPVVGLEAGVIQVTAGHGHSCALTVAGAVFCWGRNVYGELGDGSYERSFVPVPVEGLRSGVVQISGATTSTCALRESGEVWCWGQNNFGQLGRGRVSHSGGVPGRVRFGGRATEIAQLGGHACLLDARTRVWCWGRNWSGALGNGSQVDSSLPVRAHGLTDVVALAQGIGPSGAITRDGSFWCWGEEARNCGISDSHLLALTPGRADSLEGPIWRATVGPWTICVLPRSGEPGCWGVDVYGLLGIDSRNDHVWLRTRVPVRPVGGWISWPRAAAFARVDLGHDLSPPRARIRTLYRPSQDFRRSSSPWVWLRVRR